MVQFDLCDMPAGRWPVRIWERQTSKTEEDLFWKWKKPPTPKRRRPYIKIHDVTSRKIRSASSPPWELESHILSTLKFIFTYCDSFHQQIRLKFKEETTKVLQLEHSFLQWLKLGHIAHLRQQYHNSKYIIFQEKLLMVLKCYNFLWLQRRHNCCPAASFTNCVMILYLLKLDLQMFLSTPITQMPNFELWHSGRKWTISESRSEMSEKLVKLVPEKGGEGQMDWSCERWSSITASMRKGIFQTQ